MSLLVPYLIFGIALFIISVVMLTVVVKNRTIRKKYAVFSTKFGVDLLTAVCLVIVGSLNRTEEIQCDISRFISVSIPFVQALLLVSEVADWWMAASFPVYFHNSSFVCRFVPFFIGVIFCLTVMTVLIACDIALGSTTSCISSPGDTFILIGYDISLALISACLLALVVLLFNHLRTVYYLPISFHLLATFILQEIPLLHVLILRYSGHDNQMLTGDITNFCVAVHSLAHTVFFVYGHEDYRQAIISIFPNKIRRREDS